MSNLVNRRELLFKGIEDHSIVVLTSGELLRQSEDNDYPYSVNRNFFYLSNISQENSVLLFYKDGNDKLVNLFIDGYDEKKEKWFGRKITLDEAKKASKLKEVYINKEFCSTLSELANKKTVRNIYLDLKARETLLIKNVKNICGKLNIINIYPLISELRMIKDEDEIKDIVKAIEITYLGLKRVIKELKTATDEFEIYNAFNHEILNHGTHEIGFPSIIASGVHTCCLHYPTPYDKLDKKGLLLCDVGSAYNHFSSDITRTFPISGKFSPEQKKIYEIVLATNKKVINSIKPGVKLKDLQNIAINSLANGCLKAHLIKNKKDIKNYYFHGVSHHVGLDVHDASNRDLPLSKGMVITVEPGLYFEDKKIGVRIEDDVLVTEKGSKVLSINVPKEIKDIEKLFKEVK